MLDIELSDLTPPTQTYLYRIKQNNKKPSPPPKKSLKNSNARERKKKTKNGHNMVGRKNRMVPASVSEKEEKQRAHAAAWVKQMRTW